MQRPDYQSFLPCLPCKLGYNVLIRPTHRWPWTFVPIPGRNPPSAVIITPRWVLQAKPNRTLRDQCGMFVVFPANNPSIKYSLIPAKRRSYVIATDRSALGSCYSKQDVAYKLRSMDVSRRVCSNWSALSRPGCVGPESDESCQVAYELALIFAE